MSGGHRIGGCSSTARAELRDHNNDLYDRSHDYLGYALSGTAPRFAPEKPVVRPSVPRHGEHTFDRTGNVPWSITMPVTAKLSRQFYDKLGDAAANELVEWLNAVDNDYRSQLRELNELNFARFDAKMEQRFAESDGKWELRIAESDAKWERRFAETDAKWEQRFAESDAKWEQRFAEMDAKWEQRFAELEARIEMRFADMEAKFEKRLSEMDAKWELRFAQFELRIERRMSEFERRLTRWMFTFWTGQFIALAALLYAFLPHR